MRWRNRVDRDPETKNRGDSASSGKAGQMQFTFSFFSLVIMVEVRIEEMYGSD